MAKNKKQKTKKKLEIFLKLTTWKNLLRLMVKIIAIVLRQLTQNNIKKKHNLERKDFESQFFYN